MGEIYQSDLQIAVGNNNTAGLVAWESLTADGVTFLPVRSFGTYDIGERKTRLNGRPYFAGGAKVQFLASAITLAQYKYLKTTYCAGGYSGLVTIKVRTDDPATYANYNAVIIMSKESELEYRFNAYENVVIDFIDLEVIP